MVEAASGEPVLAWKSLHAETIRFGLGPDRLEIDEVRVTELDGRFVIFQDKSINVAKLMKPPAGRGRRRPRQRACPPRRPRAPGPVRLSR